MSLTYPALAERIANLPSGGALTDKNRFDRGYLYSLIDGAIAVVKRNEYTRTKKVHMSWYFPLVLTIDKSQQLIDGCYYRFDLPQIIALDARHTGAGYIGTIKFNQSFRVTIGRARFAAQQTDRYMKVRDSVTDVLLENDFCEIHGKKPIKFKIEACWASVTDLPNFNIERDNALINIDLIPEVERIITQTDLLIITKSFADKMMNMNRQNDVPMIQ